MPQNLNQKSNPFNTSPCVGRCSTVYGDQVCRGCKRFEKEVINWNQYSPNQKEQIWKRLESLINSVLPRWILIESPDKLIQFMQNQGIRYPAHLSPYAWALSCLESFPYELNQLPLAGLRAQDKKLFSTQHEKKRFLLGVQQELFEVSKAYAQRQTQYLESVDAERGNE